MVMNAGTEALKTIVTSEAKSSTLQQHIFIFFAVPATIFFAETNTREVFSSSKVWFVAAGVICWWSWCMAPWRWKHVLTWLTLMKNSNEETQPRAKRKERKCFSSGGLIILIVCLTRVRTKSTSRLPRAAKAHRDLSKHRESVLCDILRPLTNQPKMRTVKK